MWQQPTGDRKCSLSLGWHSDGLQVHSPRRMFHSRSRHWISDHRRLGCGIPWRTCLQAMRSWNYRWIRFKIKKILECYYHCTRPFSLSATHTHFWSGTNVSAWGTEKVLGGVTGYDLKFPENEFLPHSVSLSPAKLNFTIRELQYPSATKKSPFSKDATLVGLQKSFADLPGTNACPRTRSATPSETEFSTTNLNTWCRAKKKNS